MKKCLLWILLFSGLLQLGCTSQLPIQTTLPAEVPIAHDQWKVVAINRYNPEFQPFEQEEMEEVYAEGAREAFYGALDAIWEDSTFVLVYSDSLNFRMQEKGDSLSSEQLREIYQEYPYHLLLSLDHFELGMDEERVMVENSDGSVSTVADYYLLVRSSWTLYDSTGNVLDKTSIIEEEPYQSRPVFFGFLAIGPSLAKATPVINRMAWFTGYDYWSRLYPQPTTFIRPYYSWGKLRNAAAAMSEEEWGTAISLLEPLAGGEKKIAAKAAYNLAVVYEALGMIENAKYWASVANSKNNPFAAYLLPELEKYGE